MTRSTSIIRVSVGGRPRNLTPVALALAMVVLIIAVGHRATVGQAQETVSRRAAYNVKAAFLYSFGRYVTWPRNAFDGEDGPFIIGIVGENPFHDTLDQIASLKKIQGRTIAVRQFSSLEEMGPCHILFVPESVPPETRADTIKKTEAAPVLIVGESPGFAAAGGVVNFYVSAGRIRFEINPAAAKQRGLALDAKLLSLGTLLSGS